jgi:hypothetical protein
LNENLRENQQSSIVDENSSEQEKGQGRRFTGMVVMVSGLFGLSAAAIMYFDAISRGEEFLQDSQLLIVGAAILGVATLIFGLYLYIKNSK